MVALTIFSLLLLLTGTYLLTLGRYIWDAGLLTALGSLGLVIALVKAFYPGARPLHHLRYRFVRRLNLRHSLVASVLLISLVVGLAARSRSPESDFTFLLLLWLLALVGFVLALFWPPHRRRLHLPSFETSRLTWVGLVLLLGGAFLLRFMALGRVPANMGGDEGTQVLAGLKMVESPLGNPFATGWYSVPTMSFILYGVVIKICGATIAGARTLSAFVGTLTVLTTLLLGRVLGGRRFGWVAALVVAISAYHIHFSRLASNQIFDPFVATLTLWLLWRALKGTRGAAVWGLAGMMAGFGWYLYFGARWVTFMMGLWLLWRALAEHRFLARRWRGLATLIAGWLVVASPLLLWYLAHPSDLTARYNAVSIFASGWLEREVQITGKSAFALLLQQFWRSLTAFHLTSDPTFWYRPEAPLLDFALGALMLAGMIAALLRWRWPSRGLTLLWFWSTLVMAWVMTENPPSSQRGLLLVPAVAFLVAWGVEGVLSALRRRQRAALWAVRLLLILAVMLNVAFYFGIYTPRRVYGNPTAHVATDLAQHLKADPVLGSTVYFFGPPHLYWEFGTLAYLLRDVPGVNIQPGEIPDNVVRPARFVFVHERAGELDAVRAVYSGGEVTELRTDESTLLAVIYDW